MNTRGVIFVLLVAFAIVVRSQSLGTCQIGRITNYDPAQFGDSCFTGASGSATNPDDIPGIAPNEAFYRAAGTSGPACGECYEVTSNVGTQIFRVVSECPAQGNDVCQGDMVHFDIRGETAFGLVGDTKAGILWMSHKKVACPVTGNVKINVRDSNDYYLSLIVMNNKYRVDKVEILVDSAYKSFVKNNNTAMFDVSGFKYTLPATLRLTSQFGEQISFTLTSSTPGDIVTGSSNFNTATTVPDNTCYYPIPTVIYDDDFNKNLQKFPTGSNWDIGSTFAVTVNSKYTPAKVGSYALSLALDNYGGFGFNLVSFVSKTYIESIRFWAKASQATSDFKVGVVFPPTNAINLTTDWQQITVPMSQFPSVPDHFTQFTFQSSLGTGFTLYMDQVEIVLPANIVLPPMANYNSPGGSNSPGSKSPSTTSGAPTTGTTNGPSKATTKTSSGSSSIVTWIGSLAVFASIMLI